MLAGVIGTVFGIAFTVGLVALIVFLTAHRRAKKAGPNAWVEFSLRGFCGVLVFVGAVAVLMWAAVLMAINSEKPSWVFSIGIVFLIGLLRPVIQKMYGSMFVVSGEGRNAGSTGPALYPPTHFMTGETVPAQYARLDGGGLPRGAGGHRGAGVPGVPKNRHRLDQPGRRRQGAWIRKRRKR